MNCRYVARDSPRIIPGRHTDDCPRESRCDDGNFPPDGVPACQGCQPCEEQHCRVCGIDHHEHACPTCLDDTRETLAEILRMCDALPDEAGVRGVNSEAMNLLGPAADWEQANHVEASVLAGRLPADWIDHADHELHPLIVLGGWESVWREEFEAEDAKRQTVADAGAYLDRNLGRASAWPHVPFEDMARDLRRCRSHLEAVLHDGVQVDRGAPCPSCRTLLEKRWDVGQLGRDGWWCSNCKVIHTADQYDFRIKADYLEHAEWLEAVHIQQRFGVNQGTLRQWANRGDVAKKPDFHHGRMLYRVADVEARRAAPESA